MIIIRYSSKASLRKSMENIIIIIITILIILILIIIIIVITIISTAKRCS